MSQFSAVRNAAFRLYHWLTRFTPAMALLTGSLAIAPGAAQPVVLQEPDWSGMFTVGDVGPVPVLRDAARGWTYFGGGVVEGVSFPASLFRISDAGLPDTQWRLPSGFQITERYLAPDGTPIVQAYVAPGTSNFEKRWYRLPVQGTGLVTPIELPSLFDLPPRDSIDLTQNTGLEVRPFPLADGFLVTYQYVPASTIGVAGSFLLRKRDRRGNEVWSMPVGGYMHTLAADAASRLYVFGDAVSLGSTTGNFLRLNPDGSVDTAWKPDIGIASNMALIVRVVADRIIIASSVGGPTPTYRVTTLDTQGGRKLTDRELRYGVGTIADDGTVLSASAGGYWGLLDSTRNDASGDRISVARVGSPGTVQTSVPWRDGYVLGGNFLYWFDGKLYRNLMRVDAAFRPDPSWMPDVPDAVAALVVDRDGRLLVASNSASGVQARIQRFNANGALDNSWQPVFKGDVYKLLPASDGMLFVGGAYSAVNDVARNSLARFRADGTLDPEWASQPTWPVLRQGFAGWGRDGVFGLLDAGGDGVYFTWQDAYMNGAEGGVIRLARDGLGAAQTLNRGVADGGLPLRDPATGTLYSIADGWGLGGQRGTVLVRMTPPTFSVDTLWATYAGEYGRQFGGFAYQTASHIYVCRGQNVWLGMQVRRFDKTSGQEDPNWSSDETYLCNADYFLRVGDSTVVSSPLYGPLGRYGTTARNTANTVVEYYSRDAKRFFITARANEIAQLDAMPANFARTGMTFAAETALVRTFSDTTRAPVCRFYAPPNAGGSNTHFYGRESDCTLLKRFSTLRYEGFDFRVGVPVNSACPAALPQPVFRLFNNASTSNNGNHRYVVSETRRAEMLTAGWVDEGVAFCTASATDSRGLEQIQ
jgi:Domain of unknown function (DUF5122) beta-propeller/Repeat of unknown function (DUF5648)